MAAYPIISIVTPSFNDAKYLENTILSLIQQGYPNLEYIIIDGGSTDGTLDIIKKYQSKLKYWVSEKDGGMYHALQKGFEQSSGEIMGWINSDDKHQPGSLFTLAQIFTDFKTIHWIQGTPNVIDTHDRIVYAAPRPEIDKFFFYAHHHIRSNKYIQQESTFWRRNLWDAAGGFISQQYRYAGDFELWIRFFQREKLYNIPALLGSFRLTGDDQSSLTNHQEYVAETLKILEHHPLTKKEIKQLQYTRFIDKLNKRLSRWVGPKVKIDQTSVHNKIHFDNQSQKFKMR